MQLDARSIIEVVGETLAEERACRLALEARLQELTRLPGPAGERGMPGEPGAAGREGPQGLQGPAGVPAELSVVPDDIAEQVAKAIATLRESPTMASSPSIVLNINSPATKKNKTITTRRDKDGNLVADVIEQD